jgi:hypothetical protein
MSDSGLHPNFPVVEGDYQMTDEWSVTLPLPLNRRFEEGSLVMWRPRLTFWINVWGNDNNETADERLAWILEEAQPERRDERVERADGIVRLTYELPVEDPEHNPAWYTSISAYVFSDQGHVQISAYCDDGAALQNGYDVIRSVRLDADVKGSGGWRDMQNDIANKGKSTECSLHGTQGIALVCTHVAHAVDRGEKCGFYWGTNIDTARPDAWCSECEKALVALAGASSEQWFEDGEFKIFCAACWDEAKVVCGGFPR